MDYLGDILGPLRYLGKCAACGRQFMSTHDRVGHTADGELLCESCACLPLRSGA